MDKLYDEKGFLISGFSDVPSIPVNTSWLAEALLKGAGDKGEAGLSPEQIYQNITVVSEKMNSVSHMFCTETSNVTLLTDKQRTSAINMMFHLARHEYSFAVKEFLKCIGTESKQLSYNEAILFSILADAFENTMTYRKHRVPDAFSQTVNKLALLVDNDGIMNINITAFVREFFNRTRTWKNSDAFYEKGSVNLLSGFLAAYARKRRFLPYTLYDVEETMQKMFDLYLSVPAEERNIYQALDAFCQGNNVNAEENNEAYTYFQSAKVCPQASLERIFVGLLADLHYIVSEYDERQIKKMMGKR